MKNLAFGRRTAMALRRHCDMSGRESRSGLGAGRAGRREPTPAEIRPGTAQEAPRLPGEPPATIEGFRNARFGMSEEQVRQAVRKDFPAAAAKLTSAVHPAEKTIVLSIGVADLLPNTGTARISYIFGYRSKKLIQTNVVWASEGNAASDEAVVATANTLRDYFTPQSYKTDSVIANRQLADTPSLYSAEAISRAGRCCWY